MVHRMSENGKRKLAEWEGLKLEIYKDSGGQPTIGIGHLLTKRERDLGIFKDGIAEYEAYQILDRDLVRAENAVDDYVEVELTQNQFDALVSFVFNVGENAFKNSTLVRLLNQGQYDQVPAQLRRWVRDNGQVVQGLINRREKEIELWNQG